MKLTSIAALGSLALLGGCKTGSELQWDRANDAAIRACGDGNVAYVDKDDGQFGCKGAQEDTD